ncbi:8691_t:CDS:1, partial [Gigaspora margarita]
LLENVYEDIKNDVKYTIDTTQNITMVLNGWSNINREAVQNFISCLPNLVFYDAIFSGEAHHTAEWIAIQISAKMKEIGIQKFSSVITDTAANMKAAWKIIEEKYPHIICLGCSLHVINLLIGDILKIDKIKLVIENAKTIVKYFRDHHIPMAKLRCIQKENYGKEIALVLPIITRWGTHLDCIKSLLESQTAIQQMLFDQSTASLEIRIKAQLCSDEFWDDLKIVINILQPIVSTLKAFEANNSTISTTYSRFNTILTEVQKVE